MAGPDAADLQPVGVPVSLSVTCVTPAAPVRCRRMRVLRIVVAVGVLLSLTLPRAGANFSPNTPFSSINCTLTGVAAKPPATANR